MDDGRDHRPASSGGSSGRIPAHKRSWILSRAKRWEDVLVILEHGIDVLTTMNVQHLESLNDQMAQITGVKVRETIPDWVVKQADEVVMVDLTPRALLNRLERGVVYPPDKAQRAMQNFFKESTLVALREMALRQTAQEVEERIEHDGEALLGRLGFRARPARAHRRDDAVMIYVSDDPINRNAHPARQTGGRYSACKLFCGVRRRTGRSADTTAR